MLNEPITQRVKDKFAELTQEPILNVGKASGANSKSCGCPSGCNCGSPAKMYDKSMAKKKSCGSPAKIAPLAAMAIKAAIPALIGGLFNKKK